MAVIETIRMDDMDFFEIVNHFFHRERAEKEARPTGRGRVIEGTQTFDLFSMAGGFFRIKSVLGRPGKMDWIERRCLCLFFLDRIPIILSLRRRRQGRGTEHVLPSTSIRH